MPVQPQQPQQSSFGDEWVQAWLGEHCGWFHHPQSDDVTPNRAAYEVRRCGSDHDHSYARQEGGSWACSCGLPIEEAEGGWHDGGRYGKALSAHLGMTQEQYEVWRDERIDVR